MKKSESRFPYTSAFPFQVGQLIAVIVSWTCETMYDGKNSRYANVRAKLKRLYFTLLINTSSTLVLHYAS